LHRLGVITCAKLPNRKAASRPVATKLVLQWRKIIIRAISAPLVAVKVAENVKRLSYDCGQMYLYQKEKEICTRALLTNALSGETDLQRQLWRICSCFREREKKGRKKSSGGPGGIDFAGSDFLSDHLWNVAGKAKADFLCMRVAVQQANRLTVPPCQDVHCCFRLSR